MLVTAALLWPPGLLAQPVGQVLSARTGDISVIRGASPLRILQASGLDLRAWDRITAVGAGPLDLQLGTTRVQLSPGAEILISRPAALAEPEIMLLQGRIRMEHSGAAAIVGTPEALFRLNSGRSVLLRTADESRILVQAGSVELLRPDIRVLTAGEDRAWPVASREAALFSEYRVADERLAAALDSARDWSELLERWILADRQGRPVRMDAGMPVPGGMRSAMDVLRGAVRDLDALLGTAEALLADGDPSLRAPLRDRRLIESDRAEAHYLLFLYDQAVRNSRE